MEESRFIALSVLFFVPMPAKDTITLDGKVAWTRHHTSHSYIVEIWEDTHPFNTKDWIVIQSDVIKVYFWWLNLLYSDLKMDAFYWHVYIEGSI